MLLPSHLDDLKASGLNDVTIAAMRCESRDSNSISRAVFGPRPGKPLSADGYAIPYLGLDGAPVDDGTGQPMVRFKVMRGPDDAGPKYMGRVGTRNRVYLPPFLDLLLADKSAPLIITEGEKKAAKAVQEGYACVAVSGVWNWAAHPKADDAEKLTPETPIIPVLAELCRGRRILVLGDYDARPKTTQDVARAMGLLARAIRVQVPTEAVAFRAIPALDAEVKKMGLDDLLLREDGDGPAILSGLIYFDKSISPGVRASVPYQVGHTGLLRYFIPYQAADEPALPAVLVEREKSVKDDDGNVFHERQVTPTDIPYAWHKRALRVFDAPNGLALLDDPEHPVVLFDEIEGITRDRRRVTFRVAAEQLANQQLWANYGFVVTPRGFGDWLRMVRASCEAGVTPTALATMRKGWTWLPGKPAPVYVYGDNCIVPEGYEPVVPLSRTAGAQAASSGITQRGSYEAWHEVYQAVLYNPAIAALSGFAVSAPLLGLIEGMEPGIINLVGSSGCGKTTALQVISSLVGSADRPNSAGAYIGTWRTTDNGMESPLAARSDCVALLDEVHQAPAHMDWQATLYMSANGRGKARMTKETESREAKAWRVQLLSSGEESLASKVAASGHTGGQRRQMPGGLQFRVIDLDAGASGLWSDVADQCRSGRGGRYEAVLEGYGSGAAGGTEARVIEAIETALLRNHGHFWPVLVRWLQEPENVDKCREAFARYRGLLAELAGDASPVVRRRGKHVSAAMVGLLVLLDVGGFADAGAILDRAYEWAVSQLWRSGLEYTTGGEGEQMADRFIERVLAEPARFYRTGERATFKDFWGWITPEGSLYIPTGTALAAICHELGYDPARVRQALAARGWQAGLARPPQAGRSATKVRGIVSPPGLMAPVLEDEEAVV